MATDAEVNGIDIVETEDDGTEDMCTYVGDGGTGTGDGGWKDMPELSGNFSAMAACPPLPRSPAGSCSPADVEVVGRREACTAECTVQEIARKESAERSKARRLRAAKFRERELMRRRRSKLEKNLIKSNAWNPRAERLQKVTVNVKSRHARSGVQGKKLTSERMLTCATSARKGNDRNVLSGIRHRRSNGKCIWHQRILSTHVKGRCSALACNLIHISLELMFS